GGGSQRSLAVLASAPQDEAHALQPWLFAGFFSKPLGLTGESGYGMRCAQLLAARRERSMVRYHFRTVALSAATLAMAVAAVPAQAQFGGLLRGVRNVESTSTDGCSQGKSRSSGSRIAGGILGSLAGDAASRTGGMFNFVPIRGLT